MPYFAESLHFDAATNQYATDRAPDTQSGDETCRTGGRKAPTEPVIGLVSTRAGFDALEADWNDLFERADKRATAFLRFNWLWHWCNHYLPGKDEKGARRSLAIVTVRQSGRLVMIWPLVREKIGPLAQLSWMGDPVSQYGDVLIDPAADASALISATQIYIFETLKPDLLQLRKVRADSAIAPFLEVAGATVTQQLEAVSHNLAGEPGFDRYLERHSARARRNRRRQRKRLEEKGEVVFKAHCNSAVARQMALQAIEVKRVWLREKQLISRALDDKRFDAFFADVAEAASHNAQCCVSALYCDGVPTAFEINLDAKGRRFMHVIAYDLAYEKFAAGAQHMQESIALSMSNGIEVFDLLAPRAQYKTDWADDLTPVRDYALGHSLRGKAYVWGYLRHLREPLKQAASEILPRIRKLIKS